MNSFKLKALCSVLAATLLSMSLVACSDGESQQAQGDNGGAGSQTDDGIVHGRNVKTKDETGKSVVAIVMQMQEGQGLCTGSIVSEDTILTAAHCVDKAPDSLTIVFAPKVQTSKPTNRRAGGSFAQNPHWKKPTDQGQGDLALIHFEGGLPKGYAPVQLITKKIKIADGTSVLMLGYGVTNGMQNTGAGVLRETTSQITGQSSPTEMITDGQKSSVCFGDSGGPAFVQQDQGYVQWGVANSVMNQACNEASVHTNISSYLAWIKSTSAKLRKGTQGTAGIGAGRGRRSKPVELVTDDEDDAQAIPYDVEPVSEN